MDPFSLIQEIIGIGAQVYQQVELAKANKSQCQVMGRRVLSIVDALKGLPQDNLPNHRGFQSGLVRLRMAMEKCLAFIQTLSGKGWFERIINAGNHQGNFKQLNQELKSSLNVLQLGISVQQFQNVETDSAALAKDNEELRGKVDDLIILVQADRLDSSDLDSQDKEAMRQRLAVSIRQRLQVLEGKSSSLHIVPDELQIPLYELKFDKPIAQGSFGKIFRGRHAGRMVAIKEVLDSTSVAAKMQFEREIKIMGQLRSSQVVQLFGACFESDRACIVMEYCARGSLQSYLAKNKLSDSRQHRIVKDIAMGLTYLHSKNILHRDLKSANVLLDKQGQAKITDFGLSKTDRATIKTAENESAALAWLAPEVLTGTREDYSSASDVFSFGMVMWEVLTGQSPQDPTPGKDLSDYANRAEREHLGLLDPFYQELIRLCWSVNPSKRPSMEAVLERLCQHQIAELGQLEIDYRIPNTALTVDKAQKLGSGTYGVVYKGSYHFMPVAVKELVVDQATLSVETLKEFQQEIEVMMTLRSPYIVQVQGAYISGNAPQLVMEYAPRGSLYDVLKDKAVPLTWDHQYDIALGVSYGLYYLHEKGIIHRDLKSPNVLMTRDLQPKITDFGLAKIKVETSTKSVMRQSAVGSELWMAPELILDRPRYVPATDIYALAIIFWELLSRELPLMGAHSQRMASMKMTAGKRPVIPGDAPNFFAALIAQGWAQEVSERPTLPAIIKAMQDNVPDTAGLSPDESEITRLNDQIGKAEASIEQLKKTVRQKEIELTASQVQVTENSAAMLSLQARNQQYLDELNQVNKTLSEKETLIVVLESKLLDRSTELIQASSQNSAAMLSLQAKNQKNIDELNRVNQILSEKQILIVELEAKLLDQSDELTRISAQLAEKQKAPLEDSENKKVECTNSELKSSGRFSAVRNIVNIMREQDPGLEDALAAIPPKFALDDRVRQAVKMGHYRKDRREALKILNNLCADFPNDAWLRFQVGLLWHRFGNDGGYEFDSAVGRSLTRKDCYQKAISHYENSLGFDAQNGDVHCCLGWTLDRLGAIAGDASKLELQRSFLEKALECYDRAISINPENAEAFGHRGKALRRLGKVDEALDAYQQALQLGSVGVCVPIGEILKSRDQYEEAEEYFAKAVKDAPENECRHYKQGVFFEDYAKRGCEDNKGKRNQYLEHAISAYRKSIELNDRYIEPLTRLGNLLVNRSGKDNLAEAERLYSTARDLDSNNKYVKDGLKRVNKKMRNLEKTMTPSNRSPTKAVGTNKGKGKPKNSNNICQFFVRHNRCDYGDRCKFSHDISGSAGGVRSRSQLSGSVS